MERKPSCAIISALERQVLERVEALESEIDRLQRTKYLLRTYHETSISVLAEKELVARASKDLKTAGKSLLEDAEEEDLVTGFDKLDGILSLAKEIRSTNKSSKTGPQDAQRGKIGARVSLRDALAAKDEFSAPAERIIAEPSPRELFLSDMSEQLLYLSRHRIAMSPSKLYMSRIKYCEEGKFLTKVLNRPEQPDSVLFHSVYPSLPQLDSTEKQNARFSLPLSTSDSVVMRLALQFRSLVISYERYMKVRASHEAFKVTQLSAEDKKAMIAMWMRGRKLLELYKHYQKTKQNLACTCESCGLGFSGREAAARRDDSATETVDRATPYYTPLPTPTTRTDADASATNMGNKNKRTVKQSSGGGGTESSNAWADASRTRVEEFHAAYQSKILLIAESAVGQEQLKGTIQSLKTCCEESASRAKQGQIIAAGAGGADAAFVGRWAESLKQFRLVYSLLLNEAQELNHCMFINKK